MALNGTQLAESIRSIMGYPTPTSDQLIGWSTGIVNEIVFNGSATYGNTPSGHPISGLSASSMADRIITEVSQYPVVTTQLIQFCAGIVEHIHSNAIVTYSSPIKNPPTEPLGWYLGGTISGMTAAGMAESIRSNVGYTTVSNLLLAECSAIVSHIHDFGQVEWGIIS